MVWCGGFEPRDLLNPNQALYQAELTPDEVGAVPGI